MSYSSWANSIGQECLDAVSSVEAELLAAWLGDVGLQEWSNWAEANHNEALEFLSSTPAQRARRKAWKDPMHRARLAFAAYRLSCLASAVLYAGPFEGLPYRMATESAARAAFQIAKEFDWSWPFGVEPPAGWGWSD